MERELWERIKTSSVIALFIGITFSVYGPLEIVLSDPAAFWFQLSDILPTVAIAFLLAFGVTALLLFSLSYFSDVFYALFCGFGVALYIQGSITPINDIFLNTMLWIIIIAAFIILFDVKSTICKKVVIFTSVGIIGVQLFTIGALLITADNTQKDHFYVSTENQLELSEGHNIVVVVAESFDGKTFSEIIAKEPETVSQFDGFTFYPDTTGIVLGAPESGLTLLTGNKVESDRTFSENVKEAYLSTPLYRALTENGYAINVYAPESLISGDIISNIDNICQDQLRISSMEECGSLLYKMVAFHQMPYALRENFHYTVEEFTDIAVGSATNPKYIESNMLLHDEIVEKGITLSDAQNSYHLYWIDGQSESVVMDRDCAPLDTPVQETDAGYTAAQYEQAVGVVNLMGEFIAELKGKGLYDNTTIIFTADHGWSVQANPLLVVKPANSAGALHISEAPISMIEDYLPTLMYHITGNKDYGKTVYDIHENDFRERELYEYSMKADEIYHAVSVQKIWAGTFLNTHVPEMGMCKIIDLADKNCATMLGDGWHAAETWGRWASESADVKVKLDSASDLKLEVTYRTYSGSGETKILYNGQEVATLPKSELETVASITIPAEYHVSNKVQLLTFETEDAASPSKDGTGDDNRVLSIAIPKIKISQMQYTLGSLIDFTKQGNGVDYFLSGISEPEENHTWSLGKTAELRIPMAEEPDGDITAKVFLSMVFNGSQRVIIRGADAILFDGRVSPTDSTIVFKVPKNCVQNGELVLTFEYPDAVSPLEVGVSQDPRVVAVGFYAMAFDKIE